MWKSLERLSYRRRARASAPRGCGHEGVEAPALRRDEECSVRRVGVDTRSLTACSRRLAAVAWSNAERHQLEKSLPVRWSKTENVAWSLAMPESSGSTPIVWGNHVFLSVGEAIGSLALWAVDRTSGVVRWKRTIGRSRRNQRKGNNSSHHHRSPMVDRLGHHRNGVLKAFDFARQGIVEARHSDGLRSIRLQCGLRIVAAAVRGFPVCAGPARDAHRQSVLSATHRQGVLVRI